MKNYIIKTNRGERIEAGIGSPKWKILDYRRAKESAGGYLTKKSPSRKKKKIAEESLPPIERQPLDEKALRGMYEALRTHHNPREQDTFIYVARKNIEKKARTDRQFYYDGYSVSHLDWFLRRSDISTCDFFATAAEYTFDLKKIKVTKVTRTNKGGSQREEIRRTISTRREKWVEAIQLNFLQLNFRKSELGYIPTIDEAKNLIYARCEELKLPKPVIVDTGDNGETLELRWLWQNFMKNCGERDDFRIKYPKFNRDFDAMQDKLFCLFWDFGADEHKLSVISMLNVAGTINSKTGIYRQIVGLSDEILTYQELDSRISLNFGFASVQSKSYSFNKNFENPEEYYYDAQDFLEPQEFARPQAGEKEQELQKRSPSAVAKTLSREIEKVSRVSAFTKFASELAEYADFEILTASENSQNDLSKDFSDESEFNEPEIKKSDASEILPMPEHQVNNFNDDLSRLHSGGDYWVCFCTENKSKGERGQWREYWTFADKVHETLERLKRLRPDFDEFNVYVSQLEFRGNGMCKPQRKVEKVAAFRTCFVDIDGKYTNEKYSGYDRTAEGWKNLVLKFCADKKLPTPSEMVFSGNGVHVKYFFDKFMTCKEFPRWERLEKILSEIFKEIGADPHSTDGARVLRVAGTKNNKPDTKDRDVRVIFTGGNYDFENFARTIEALSPEIKISESEQEQKASAEIEKPISENKSEENKNESNESAKIEADKKADKKSEILERSDFMSSANSGKSKKSWFYLSIAGTKFEAWLDKNSLMNSLEELKKLDSNQKFECSVVEYKSQKRHDRKEVIDNFYFSYVILNNSSGESLEEKIEKIKKHCREYRGVGIPEPNKIIEDGKNLILLWRYSKERFGRELPGIALPRWKTTQEYLNNYFLDLGAVKIAAAQKSTTLLPLPGFAGVKLVYENDEMKYLFDDLASAVLPFSQKEVADYLSVKKAYNRSIVLEPITELYVQRRKAHCQTSRFSPALKIFNDIARLLRIRAAKSPNGEVPEGRRELCVFYALDFAVQAGFIKRGASEDFNELAQRLIDLCGVSFNSDCSPNVMTTLRGKFLNEMPVYRPQKKTLIKRLEITPEEQAELDILKLNPSEMAEPKQKKVSIWKLWGIPKATYYRHKKEAKENAAKFREAHLRHYFALWILNKLVQLLDSSNSGKMRLKNSTYYESGRSLGDDVGIRVEKRVLREFLLLFLELIKVEFLKC